MKEISNVYLVSNENVEFIVQHYLCFALTVYLLNVSDSRCFYTSLKFHNGLLFILWLSAKNKCEASRYLAIYCKHLVSATPAIKMSLVVQTLG